MAHTHCPAGHDMWNGDGKPVVYAYRVGFFEEFMKEHPDCVLGSRDYLAIYDCVDYVMGEDLDCWYCDECQGLVVFVDNLRYDYVRMERTPSVLFSEVSSWEEYIGIRDQDFEDFSDAYQGKSPLDAIADYDFKYKYRLSPDKRTIYAFDRNQTISFAYSCAEYTQFSPDMEEWYTDDQKEPYKPYSDYKGKVKLNIKTGCSLYLKDDRDVIVKDVISPGDRFWVVGAEDSGMVQEEITLDAVNSVHETFIK